MGPPINAWDQTDLSYEGYKYCKGSNGSRGYLYGNYFIPRATIQSTPAFF